MRGSVACCFERPEQLQFIFSAINLLDWYGVHLFSVEKQGCDPGRFLILVLRQSKCFFRPGSSLPLPFCVLFPEEPLPEGPICH